MRPRRFGPARHRKDGNSDAISEAATKAGFLVYPLNTEFCDLLVQFQGQIEAWEVKAGPTAAYTDGQKQLLDKGWKIRRVETDQDVLEARRRMLGQATNTADDYDDNPS